jgi:gas vesicle protein
MDFWIGLTLGLFTGAIVGFIAAALCKRPRRHF